MSTGIAALDKRDQAQVHEWLRLEALARQAAPRRDLWPLLHLLTFAVGLACGWWLR